MYRGNPWFGVYQVWDKNEERAPLKTLRSLTPLIIAKIYRGNPYPDFDYTDAVERRIKLDIQTKADYGNLVAGQINDKHWHLQAAAPFSAS